MVRFHEASSSNAACAIGWVGVTERCVCGKWNTDSLVEGHKRILLQIRVQFNLVNLSPCVNSALGESARTSTYLWLDFGSLEQVLDLSNVEVGNTDETSLALVGSIAWCH